MKPILIMQTPTTDQFDLFGSCIQSCHLLYFSSEWASWGKSCSSSSGLAQHLHALAAVNDSGGMAEDGSAAITNMTRCSMITIENKLETNLNVYNVINFHDWR